VARKQVVGVIHELRIRGLGVIAATGCSFAPGFTAVTGETGAGKTMVVTSLGLLIGGRSDSGLVRAGDAAASVEGDFDVTDQDIETAVLDAGGQLEDGGLTAARIVAARGRSILGGRTVPTAVLGEVIGSLLVIHGQHDQSRLAGRALGLLDAFAGASLQPLRTQVGAAHQRWMSARTELDLLRTSVQERARELDVLTFSLEEIAEIDPQPGEDAQLQAEQARLANIDALQEAAATARGLIASEEADGRDVMGLLAVARRALEVARADDPALAGPADALRSVMAQLGELAADLSTYLADLDADPRRLAVVQQRQADLARLTRKYGATADEVLAWSAASARRVAELTGADDRIRDLEVELAAAAEELGTVCGRLHDARVAAAGRFAAEVTGELAALAMPRARVEFLVGASPDADGIEVPGLDGPVAVRASGVDEVTLALAAHPDAPLRPIAQAASGGELSRTMLAIQVVLAGADPVPTMVFDEVDAGVGGAAAIEVGRRLQRLSERTQVIVVTHLAQVAAFADHQLVVTKGTDGVVTESCVVAVAGEDRVRELSRMLGGLADSESAGAHARELLALTGRG
jgi:DNA repair protein RecN (Recombination protein N)